MNIKYRLHTILAIIILCLPSCTGSIDVLGKKVAIVNDRAPNGTFLPVSEIKHPATGETPLGSARLYAYPGGDIAVSVYGSGPLSGISPKLKH